jgi:Homologous recombination OB-fold protein
MLKSNKFSGQKSDCLQEQGIWVNLQEKRDSEVNLDHIHSSKTEKYPKIYLLLKEYFRTEFGSAQAIFQSFNGSRIQATIYKRVFTQFHKQISIGNLFELVNVSVLSIQSEKHIFLDSANIAKIILAKDYSVFKNTPCTRLASTSTVTSKVTSTIPSAKQNSKSSGRLRLSDVEPLREKNIPVTSTCSNNANMDDYDTILKDLNDDFEDY